MTVDDLTHVIIDALERVGTRQNYYRLNHTTPQERAILERMVAEWCRSIGILVG